MTTIAEMSIEDRLATMARLDSEQMLPGFSLHNQLNGVLIEAEFSGKCHLSHRPNLVVMSDFKDIVFGQFCRIDSFTSGMSFSAYLVFHVALMRARVDMGWVAARRVVTVMAANRAISHGPVLKFPGLNMSADAMPAESRAEPEDTVAVLIDIRCPRPTFVRATNIHLGPEAGGEVTGVGGPELFALRRAKDGATRREVVECTAASTAGRLYMHRDYSSVSRPRWLAPCGGFMLSKLYQEMVA